MFDLEKQKIEKEIAPLNDLLNWILKTEELQKRGYVEEQVLNDIQTEIIEQEEMPEIDTTSSLKVTFPPLT